jgi:phosphoribosyl 1,2-cyclic phosphodiesterase
MKLKFWGVRGSIPVPGPKTLKYGGNTSCVELNCDKKTIILDCGTGIRALGLDIEERGLVQENRKKDLYIFFSHVHWDHIQGFPFFRPNFDPEFEINLYSALHSDVDIECALRDQMIAPYFPIRLRDMPARMNFKEIKSGEAVQIGNIVIESISLNHPGGSLGYKIICENKSVAYICDHEHTEKSKQRLVNFLKNTNQVIFDAHYSPEEYSGADGDGGRKGWGHSTWVHGVELCREANIDQLILTHHGHEDTEIERIELMAQKEFCNTIAAYEGLEIDLG